MPTSELGRNREVQSPRRNLFDLKETTATEAVRSRALQDLLGSRSAVALVGSGGRCRCW
jgi:hypothetical protein